MPSEKVLPAKMNMELIARLQNIVAPNLFQPKVVYDGRKNIFAIKELPLENGSKTVTYSAFSITQDVIHLLGFTTV